MQSYSLVLLSFSCFTTVISAAAVQIQGRGLADLYSEVSQPIVLRHSQYGAPRSYLQTRSKLLGHDTLPLTPQSDQILTSFETDLTIGNQNFSLVVDTGSSNLWVMAEGVDCRDSTTLERLNATSCGFRGPRFTPDSTFQLIPDKHLNASYANGELINGRIGYESVTLGNLHIPKQVVGLGDYAAVDYPGGASGILGLAFSSVSTIYPGAKASQQDILCSPYAVDGTQSCNEEHTSTLLDNVFQQKSTPPVFAVALSRNSTQSSNGGVLTIGGIPCLNDPKINATGPIASTPIEKLRNSTDFSLYVTNSTGFVYTGNKKGTIPSQLVLDTGTSQNFLGPNISKEFNALFDPPAIFNETFQAYLVNCTAKAPELGVTIAGQTFYHNPADLVLRGSSLPPGICLSAIQAGPSSTPTILGSTFLKNVLAVFDIGTMEVKLTSRVNYQL